MAETLAERQAAILRAIVREYVRTGEPVGSKALVDRSRLSVSPATVRNEMSHLEELGYLAQPHTSAGRIPTDLGYRFVVDEITAPKPLAEGQRRALREELTETEPTSIEDLLHRASEVVARFTHHAAAVLARRARPDRVRRLELFPMGARMANLVLIAQNGRVEQRMLAIDPTLNEADVEALGARLAKSMHDRPLDDVAASLQEESKKAQPRERALIDGIAAAVGSLRDAQETFVVGGVANLAGETDFEREQLHRLYEALEQQSEILKLLASAFDLTPVSVRIGTELPVEDFHSCSLVVANFGATGSARGSVGVIGPMRMDYDRVIATADAVARLLENALGSDAPA